MRLYDIPEEVRQIDEELRENGGDLTPELQERIGLTKDTLQTKGRYIMELIRENTVQAEAAKAEEKRLADIRKSYENAAERQRAYLKGVLEALGMPGLDCTTVKANIQRNSQPSVKFDGNPGTLPVQFTKISIELNRAAVLEAVKEGSSLPAGITVETGTHLRIK